MSNEAAQEDLRLEMLVAIADLADAGFTAPRISDELGVPLSLVAACLYGPGDLPFGGGSYG